MEYIRHLGIVAPESQPQYSARDVSPDADGWVYLNLLGNLAQLHILNVSLDFIRSAVSEKSTKFQLSPDGRKIRWRGGDEGTRFTSDTGSKSQTDRSSDETDGSNALNQRKKQKGSRFNLGVQDSNSSENFHYKPLFVHHQTSFDNEEQLSVGGSGSANGFSEDSTGKPDPYSKWDQSRVSTGQSQRKRRRDGAIIYYSGAPFCTDLSGDCSYGEVSPVTYDMTSSGDQPMQEDPVALHLVHRPFVHRSASGSSIPFRPLSELGSGSAMVGPSSTSKAEPTANEADDCIEADFPWSNSEQQAFLTNLEASGLGGVSPDDHFVVVVSTRRPKKGSLDDGIDSDEDHDTDDGDVSPGPPPRLVARISHDIDGPRVTADLIANKLALMSTKAPTPGHAPTRKGLAIKIRYITGKIHRLPPVPLPPPTFYFPSGDSDSEYGASLEEDISVSSERSILSKRPMLEGSLDSDNRDLSGNDEEDEHDEDGEPIFDDLSPGDITNMPGTRHQDEITMPPLSKHSTGSSAATAGGAGSGYYSSMEDA